MPKDFAPEDFAAAPLTGAEIDTMRCLFFHGPTWDGNVPSKSGRDSLVDRGLAEHEFGWAWLTRDGVQVAVQIRGLDREKDRWQAERRRAAS